MRTFRAIEFDAALRRKLAAVREDSPLVGRSVRWVRAENLHLTLKFLGEVEDSRIPSVTAALARASVGVKVNEGITIIW